MCGDQIIDETNQHRQGEEVEKTSKFVKCIAEKFLGAPGTEGP